MLIFHRYRQVGATRDVYTVLDDATGELVDVKFAIIRNRYFDPESVASIPEEAWRRREVHPSASLHDDIEKFGVELRTHFAPTDEALVRELALGTNFCDDCKGLGNSLPTFDRRFQKTNGLFDSDGNVMGRPSTGIEVVVRSIRHSVQCMYSKFARC